MKSYDKLEIIQQQMVEATNNKRTNAFKEAKRLCNEFGFTAEILEGTLAKGRSEN